jgi:hypothetical protein
MLRIRRLARRLWTALFAHRRSPLFSTSPTVRFSDFVEHDREARYG